MKRVITLLLAAAMLLGLAGLAGAVDFSASGHMQVVFGVKDNDPVNSDGDFIGYDKDADEDNFYSILRFRPKLTMKGQGVTAVFEAQSHQAYFGSDWKTNSPDIDFRVRNAYIDFKLPGTPVSLKMGFQQISLPGHFGNPIFDDRVGGVVASIPVNEQISVAAFWARPLDQRSITSPDEHAGVTIPTRDVSMDASHNAIDMFGVLVPMNFGSVKATPYFVYARIGNAEDEWVWNATEYDHIGKSLTDSMLVGGVNLALSPMKSLTVNFDAMFTNYKSDYDDYDVGLGWMAAFAVDYAMPFGTPGVFGWYSSGADDDGEGYLMVLDTGGDGFWPTSYGFEGYNGPDRGGVIGSWGQNTMGVGLQVADLSFLDGLSHTVRVAYIRGTADDYFAGTNDWWTEEDSFIEVNFDSSWNLYENLAAHFDMGLIMPDLDHKVPDDMTWRAQVTFAFTF